MDTNEGEVRIKNCMIEEAKTIYLLADSTKMNGIAYVTTCRLDKIDVIITDDGIKNEDKEALEASGVKVIVAK